MANSNQNTETPWGFVKAIEKHFAIEFEYDIASDPDSQKARFGFYERDDNLSLDWPLDGWCWLNPSFAKVGAWAKKCKEQMKRGCKIISVWPLSADLNMIDTWQYAQVNIIHGRLWPEVRGVMVCIWDAEAVGGVDCLRWDRDKGTLISVGEL